MNPSAHTPGVGVEPVVENWRNDEGALLTMLEEVERKHGYIPQQVGDEVSRLLELKLAACRTSPTGC